jgi:predicted RNA-binding protein YlxR (DUF448 family)
MQNRPATGGPIRTCIACARAFAVRKSRRSGITFAALGTEGALQVLHVCAQREEQPQAEPPQVLVDATGSTPGRGAWLCAQTKCVEQAWKRKAIERALKGARTTTI